MMRYDQELTAALGIPEAEIEKSAVEPGAWRLRVQGAAPGAKVRR